MTIYEEQAQQAARARLATLREAGSRRLVETAAGLNADIAESRRQQALAGEDPESAAVTTGLQSAGECIARVLLAFDACPLAGVPALVARVDAALAG